MKLAGAMTGLLLASLGVLLWLCHSSAQVRDGPVVWVASSLERIGREDRAGTGTLARLQSARGEYESFQIVVRAPPGGLTRVTLEMTDLTGPAGESLPKSAFTLYREHYVYLSRSSPDLNGRNRPGPRGWYADPLIPAVEPPAAGAALVAFPFSLDEGRNQPVWVDVFVPPTARPGVYTGAFTVSSDQGRAAGEIQLRVWNFVLPLKPSLKTAFQIWKPDSREANVELLRHRISPTQVSPADQRRLADLYGLAAVHLGFSSGADSSTCSMRQPPEVATLQAAAARQQPDLFLYNYTADEIDACPFLFEPLRHWARNLHAAGVRNLVTMKPVRELYFDGGGGGRSAVDVWVLLPKMYDEALAAVRDVLAKGDEIWSYNALVQDSYSPKWQIDFSPADFRVQPGFLSQSLGLTGLLYWRVDRWSKTDPWNDVTGVFGWGSYPGEGLLVYPGRQAGISGVAPSMRLKWIRDGIEDFEYVELLKKSGRGDRALQIARAVGQDWANWTRDGNLLESARQQLAQELDRLSDRRSDIIPSCGIGRRSR